MSCIKLISSGIPKDCDNITAPIGSEKDLILVNYSDFDRVGTLEDSNFENDDTNGNEGGITTIKLLSGAVEYTFEGTEYSVVPNVTSEIREDGDSWYIHSVAFMVYNKTAAARKAIADLANSKVVAIVVERSTGFYELFGAEQGLKITETTREYVGSQNSNFYSVTIGTPDIAVIRENNLGLLCTSAPVVTP